MRIVFLVYLFHHAPESYFWVGLVITFFGALITLSKELK